MGDTSLRRLHFWIAFFATLFLFTLSASADTLQQQIDKTPAGGTLTLFDREYMETAVIKKPITIIGGEETLLMSDSDKPVFTIKDAENVTLRGLHFLQSNAAVVVKNSSKIQLDKLEMIQMFSGVQVYDSKDVTIKGLTLKGIDGQFASKGYGLAVFKSSNVTLDHNDVTSVQDAYYLEHTKDVTVTNNIATDSRYGLHFMYADGIKAEHNTLKRNVTGIMLMLAKNASLRYNDISLQWDWNSSGFTLYNAENIVAENNVFSGNRTGILSQTLKNAQIQHNIFSSNQTAIEFTAADKNNTVTNNDFVGNILNIRSDGSDSRIDKNYYDDYDGNDIDDNGVGDTNYVALQSFGQWMVREPAYQYFIESPAVIMLNQMDKQTNRVETNQLVDSTPMMEPTSAFHKEYAFHLWSFLIGLIMLTGAIFLWRKGVKQ